MKQYLSIPAMFALAIVLGAGVYGTSASAQTADTTATTTAAVTASTTAATTTVATTTTATTTPVVATTTASTISSARLAEMLEQIKKLTALLATLRAQMASTTGQIQTIAAEVRLGLRSGMTGEDIKAVQEALASDPTIYPAGLKTGYFGPMTVEAIKRFQTKNGLEVTGEINAETKAALDTVMEARKAEGKFPLGLLLAPGMKQKFEDRVRMTCGTASSTTPAAGQCEKVRAKYKFEIDEKGRVKMETKIKKEDDDKNDDSDEDEDEDEDEDGDEDDSDDKDDDSDEDDN